MFWGALCSADLGDFWVFWFWGFLGFWGFALRVLGLGFWVFSVYFEVGVLCRWLAFLGGFVGVLVGLLLWFFGFGVFVVGLMVVSASIMISVCLVAYFGCGLVFFWVDSGLPTVFVFGGSDSWLCFGL